MKGKIVCLLLQNALHYSRELRRFFTKSGHFLRTIRFDVGTGGMCFVGGCRTDMFFKAFSVKPKITFFIAQTENSGIKIAW